MTEEQKREVTEALVKFILRVTDCKAIKMPEEVDVLPAIVSHLYELSICDPTHIREDADSRADAFNSETSS